MTVFKNKMMWAGFLGNILETYDLIIYGLMAPYIAEHFFNPNHRHRLLQAFFILFLGYLARPVGALIFGFLSDYQGRKKAIAFSTLLVGLTTTLTGLLPSYAMIGITATYLLLLLRLAQGIALGGEYTNSIIFLVEHGYQKQRGFMGSWATNGNCVGFLLASLVGTMTVTLLSHQWMPAWGWRYPFLLASVGALFIFWMQYTSRETLPFILANATETPHFFKTYIVTLMHTIREKKRECGMIIAMMWLSVSFTYLIFIYGPTHIAIHNHLPLHRALEINAVSLLCLILLTPCFGYWSDRYGRKPLLLFATLMFLVGAYPYFTIISHGHVSSILMMQLLFAIPAATFYGIAPVLMVELIPIKTRGMISGLIYNITASVIGGSAPVLALTLIHYTKNPVAPAYYLIISAIITLIALLRLKEPVRIDESDASVTAESHNYN